MLVLGELQLLELAEARRQLCELVLAEHQRVQLRELIEALRQNHALIWLSTGVCEAASRSKLASNSVRGILSSTIVCGAARWPELTSNSMS